MSRIQEIRQELESIANQIQIVQSEVMNLQTQANSLGREMDNLDKPSRWYPPEECNFALRSLSCDGGYPLKEEVRELFCKNFEGFPTESDAEYYREIPRSMRPLAKALRELNDGWWPGDWNRKGESKYYAYYDHESNEWDIGDCLRFQHCHSALYAKSSEIMLQALEIAQLEPPL